MPKSWPAALVGAFLLLLSACPRPRPNPGYVEYSRVSAGSSHTCALAVSGEVYCWGYNTTGQLGTNDTTASPRPKRVGGGHLFTSVSAGGSHSCGVSEGQVLCWGNNSYGQLGIASVGGMRLLPVQSATPAGKTFASVHAGGDYTCALTTTGEAFCWGHNVHGQLGNNATQGKEGSPTDADESKPVPTAVAGGIQFRGLAVGGRHVCGYTAGMQAYCWGGNLFNQVSDDAGPTTCASGTSSWSCYLTPQPINVPGGATGVAAGGDFSCATNPGYDLYCWGGSAAGQLGAGTKPCSFANGMSFACARTPIALPKVNQKGFVQISAGEDAICSSVYPVGSSVMCWGRNDHGQLADGTVKPLVSSPPAATPHPLIVNLGALDVSLGATHGCIVTDGYLSPASLIYCWGSNISGQVGTGTASGDEPTPRRVVEP